MVMQPVSSDNIAAVGYEDSTLLIMFHSGYLYAYSNIPRTHYTGLLSASSPTQYLNDNIKGRYPYDRVFNP